MEDSVTQDKILSEAPILYKVVHKIKKFPKNELFMSFTCLDSFILVLRY